MNPDQPTETMGALPAGPHFPQAGTPGAFSRPQQFPPGPEPSTPNARRTRRTALELSTMATAVLLVIAASVVFLAVVWALVGIKVLTSPAHTTAPAGQVHHHKKTARSTTTKGNGNEKEATRARPDAT